MMTAQKDRILTVTYFQTRSYKPVSQILWYENMKGTTISFPLNFRFIVNVYSWKFISCQSCPKSLFYLYNYTYLNWERYISYFKLNRCFRSYCIISTVHKPEILEEELICWLHLPSLSKFQAMIEKRESKQVKTQIKRMNLTKVMHLIER